MQLLPDARAGVVRAGVGERTMKRSPSGYIDNVNFAMSIVVQRQPPSMPGEMYCFARSRHKPPLRCADARIATCSTNFKVAHTAAVLSLR